MKNIIVTSCLLVISGCVTPYQQEASWGGNGGYSEMPLAANVYEITFVGNSSTNSKQVQEMAMLRGAELAEQNGYSYFSILDRNNWSKKSTRVHGGNTTSNTTGTVTANKFGNRVNLYGNTQTKTTQSPVYVTNKEKYRSSVVVEFVVDAEASERGALSVEQIYRLYADKYGLVR